MCGSFSVSRVSWCKRNMSVHLFGMPRKQNSYLFTRTPSWNMAETGNRNGPKSAVYPYSGSFTDVSQFWWPEFCCRGTARSRLTCNWWPAHVWKHSYLGFRNHSVSRPWYVGMLYKYILAYLLTLSSRTVLIDRRETGRKYCTVHLSCITWIYCYYRYCFWVNVFSSYLPNPTTAAASTNMVVINDYDILHIDRVELTSDTVSTGIHDQLRMGKPPHKPPTPTQPPVLSRTWNGYRPKCNIAVWLGSKGSLFHLWINVSVAGAGFPLDWKVGESRRI